MFYAAAPKETTPAVSFPWKPLLPSAQPELALERGDPPVNPPLLRAVEADAGIGHYAPGFAVEMLGNQPGKECNGALDKAPELRI